MTTISASDAYYVKHQLVVHQMSTDKNMFSTSALRLHLVSSAQVEFEKHALSETHLELEGPVALAVLF